LVIDTNSDGIMSPKEYFVFMNIPTPTSLADPLTRKETNAGFKMYDWDSSGTVTESEWIMFNMEQLGSNNAQAASYLSQPFVSAALEPNFDDDVATGRRKKAILENALGGRLEDTSSADSRAATASTLLGVAQSGDVERMRNLLSEGSDPDQADFAGWTPLMFADDAEMARTLIDSGANLELQALSPRFGYTALMGHCEGGRADVVRVLLEAGAKPDLQEKSDKMTALMFAVGKGNPEAVQALLEYGADMDLSSSNGDTALSLAEYALNPQQDTLGAIAQAAKKFGISEDELEGMMAAGLLDDAGLNTYTPPADPIPKKFRKQVVALLKKEARKRASSNARGTEEDGASTLMDGQMKGQSKAKAKVNPKAKAKAKEKTKQRKEKTKQRAKEKVPGPFCLPGDDTCCVAGDVACKNRNEILRFLHSLSVTPSANAKYMRALEDEGIDLEALMMLGDADLKELGFKKGTRVKILHVAKRRAGIVAEGLGRM
jgi:hypothetical protein